MRISTARLRALAVALVLSVSGCGGEVFKHVKGTTYGEITVGDARVSSRERLVNDRLTQDTWLKDQLSRSDEQEFGFQGAADLRSFMGASTRVEATTNQVEIDRYRAQASQSADAARRSQEQAELDNQLLRQYKQRQLEAMAQQPSSAFAYTPPAGKPEAPAAPQPPTGPTVVEDVRRLRDDAGKFTIDPSTIKLPEKLKPSPQEVLRDKLEYRGLIRTEILENALDDRHDLRGNTMLRFDLDAAVRPEDDTSAWAVITVEVDTSQWRQACIDDGLYEKWRRHVERELRERAVLLIRNGAEAARVGIREEGPKASEAEKARGFVAGLMAYLPEYLSLEIQREWMKKKPYARYWEVIYVRTRERLKMKPQPLDSKEGQLVDPPSLSELRQQIYIEINAAHRRLLKALFGEFINAEIEDETLQLKSAATENVAEVFCKRLHERADVYAYAATPKESVQRVAEVASRRNVSEFMLALSFLAGNSAAGKLYTDYMKVSEGIFQAIHRQPLVVGFSKGTQKTAEKNVKPTMDIQAQGDPCDPKAALRSAERCTSFGWILGPRFAIKNDGSGSHYRHTVAFNSLSSFISLPGWLSSVDFKVKAHWVNDDGVAPETGSAQKTVPVRLKPDLATITDVLAKDSIREPRPYTRQLLEFDEGAAVTVVIPGQNLWRNPTVLIGSQQADEVTVLPDMRGLLAKFKELKLQRPKGSDEWDVLQVWTSEGSAEAALVKINPAKAPAAQSKIVLASAAAIAGKPLEIGLTPPQKGFSAMSVAFLNAGAGDLKEEKVISVLKQGEAVAVNVPTLQKTNSGDPIQVQVSVKALPDAQPAQVLGVPATAIYYGNEDAANAKLKPEQATLAALKDTKFTVAFPRGTAIAYPGSEAEKLDVVLEPKDGKGPAAKAGKCERDPKRKDPDQCVFTVEPPAQLESAVEYVVKVMARGRPLPIAPDAIKVTLKEPSKAPADPKAAKKEAAEKPGAEKASAEKAAADKKAAGKAPPKKEGKKK